jgi:hypothetical protein
MLPDFDRADRIGEFWGYQERVLLHVDDTRSKQSWFSDRSEHRRVVG